MWKKYLKAVARPLALTIVLFLGGESFDQDENSQYTANIYSSDHV